MASMCSRPIVGCKESYVYSPLQSDRLEIRILKLLPAASGKEPLRFTLQHADLSAKPSFEALSYTWGSLKGPSSCQCSVLIDGKALTIMHNLGAALLRIRRQDEPRTLWIDAICINQADLAERNRQVQIMGHIYGKAYGVVVWLGEEDSGSSEALQHLASVSTYGFFDTTTVGEGDPVLRKRNPGFEDMMRRHKQSHAIVFPYIRDLLLRPWFTRMWVVQELVLAKRATIQCGAEVLNWDEFSSSLAVLIHLEMSAEATPDPEFARTLQHIVKMDSHRRMTRQLSINWLVYDYRNSLATDPRDKLYSLFGIAQNAEVAVDYSEPAELLYVRMAAHIIKMEDSLSLLHAVQGSTTDLEALPSLPTWVPDWRMPWAKTPTLKDLFFRFATAREAQSVKELFGLYRDQGRLGLGIGGVHPSVEFSLDLRVLRVVGVEWSRIEEVWEVNFGDDTNTPACPSPLGESGRFWERLAASNDEKRQACEHKEGVVRSLRDVVLDYVEQVSIVYERKLARLQNGVWGIANRTAEVGDLVCFLYNEGVPFVLRTQQAGPDHNVTVVGQFLAEEVLDGMAISQIQSGVPKFEYFCLQ